MQLNTRNLSNIPSQLHLSPPYTCSEHLHWPTVGQNHLTERQFYNKGLTIPCHSSDTILKVKSGCGILVSVSAMLIPALLTGSCGSPLARITRENHTAIASLGTYQNSPPSVVSTWMHTTFAPLWSRKMKSRKWNCYKLGQVYDSNNVCSFSLIVTAYQVILAQGLVKWMTTFSRRRTGNSGHTLILQVKQ